MESHRLKVAILSFCEVASVTPQGDRWSGDILTDVQAAELIEAATERIALLIQQAQEEGRV